MPSPSQDPSISENTYPTPFTIHPLPSRKHTNTLILLHGTSTTGPEFGIPFISFKFPFPPSTDTKSTLPTLLPTTRLVFPTGKRRTVTVLNGKEANAWFDFTSFSDRTVGEEGNVEGLRESVVFLAGLVKSEVEVLRRSLADEGFGDEEVEKRVIIGGFSQGCAMVSVLELSRELDSYGTGEGVGGVIGLSGWLPFRKQIRGVLDGVSLLELDSIEGSDNLVLQSRRSEAVTAYVRNLLSLPTLGEDDEGQKGSYERKVFLAHGTQDTKMLPEWGMQVRDVLRGSGRDVVWREDQCGHAWCEDEVGALVEWIVGIWGDGVLGR